MADRPTCSAEALALALDWASGKRSWVNLGPHEPYTPDVIAVMDAQQAVAWATVAKAMHAMEVRRG